MNDRSFWKQYRKLEKLLDRMERKGVTWSTYTALNDDGSTTHFLHLMEGNSVTASLWRNDPLTSP